VNNMFSKAAIWVVIALVLFTVFKQFDGRSIAGGASSVAYSDFLDEVKSKHIKEATIEDRTIVATTMDGKKIKTAVTYLDRGLIGDLVNNGVKFDVKQPEEQSFLSQVFISWFPMLLLIGVWIFFMRQMQGGGKGGAFSFGRSKARMLMKRAIP
jgi:cell division protease FtsH